MLNVEQNPVGPQRQFRRSGKKTVCNSRDSAHFIRQLIHSPWNARCPLAPLREDSAAANP
jgi:hypothetical protein